MSSVRIPADPYEFPLDDTLSCAHSALLVIDMQRDFLSPGGYMDQRGEDLSLFQAVIPCIQRLLGAARGADIHIFHTREGHRPDGSDLPRIKRLRSRRAGSEIGSSGPLGRLLTRGEAGWEIIPELAPHSREPVIDKPGTGAFFATDLDFLLRQRGVRQLILCGVTTAVCVATTLREASDRGYDTLLVADCCAESDPALHEAAVQTVKLEGGYFGTVADSDDVVAALEKLARIPETAP